MTDTTVLKGRGGSGNGEGLLGKSVIENRKIYKKVRKVGEKGGTN